CPVVAVPPRSRVWFFGSAITSRHAWLIAFAAFGWPRNSSIIATLRNVAIGFAKPLPAMSGAEPWTGSNMLAAWRVGLRLPLAAIPIPPWIAAPRSVMMSPNMLVVTITSYTLGLVT